jgi:hypothetical protein
MKNPNKKMFEVKFEKSNHFSKNGVVACYDHIQAYDEKDALIIAVLKHGNGITITHVLEDDNE